LIQQNRLFPWIDKIGKSAGSLVVSEPKKQASMQRQPEDIRDFEPDRDRN